MILFPAIDIKNGRVVRLLQGKYDQVTEYATDPVQMAKHWESQGAAWIHVVDLDGALEGTVKNLDAVMAIARGVKIPVEMGGGVRNHDVIDSLLEGGISRVILGTKVVEDRGFLKQALKKWGKRIAVSVDCSNGFVAQRGWTSTSTVKDEDLIKELETLGVGCIIYTDIARDGMLTGPDITGLSRLLKITTMPIIASGGVSSLEDIKALKALEPKGLLGAITGKALYEGKFELKEALKLC